MSVLSPKYWYIDGVAYDFTPFAKKHPGGQFALYLGKGQECRSLIESYHMNLPSQSLFDKYKVKCDEQPDPRLVAKFAPAQKFTYDENGFFRTVKREVKEYFTKQGLSYKADPLHMFYFYADLVLMLLSLWYMIAYASPLAALAHGFFRGIMVVQTTHAASHHSMSFNANFNRWAYRVGTVLIGMWCPTIWDIQHVVAHHVYTNEWPFDSDSAFPLKSIAPNQRRLSWHKYQHLYMWLVYALFLPVIMLNSIRELYVGKQVTFAIRYWSREMRLEAWGTTLGAAVYFSIPFWFLPFSSALGLVLLSNLFSSLYFSLQFIVNHEVAEIVCNKDAPASIDFGAYQLGESFSFAPQSQLALELSGGLNTQVEHHLFPSVHYGHYKNISPIVQKVAKEFGLTYYSKPTWTEALVGHYTLLKNPPKSDRDRKNKLKEMHMAKAGDSPIPSSDKAKSG